MGMYTELVIKCHIKADAPQQVKDILAYMFAKSERPEVLPCHTFFKLPRWDMIGSCSSFYHHPEAVSSFPEFDFTERTYLFSRSDIKNYDNEIGEFIHWIRPFLDEEQGKCIGWTWYEEDMQPTLLVM